MYSEAFMRYLINYQKPEYDESVYKQTKNFNYKSGGLKKLAEVLVTVRK